MTLELDMDDIKKLFSSFGYTIKLDRYGAYEEETYRAVTKKDGKHIRNKYIKYNFIPNIDNFIKIVKRFGL